jgi:hypothetical protein
MREERKNRKYSERIKYVCLSVRPHVSEAITTTTTTTTTTPTPTTTNTTP